MKNGNELPILKRYDVNNDKYGNTCGEMEESPDGDWVKYNDVWTLENNIFVALNEVESLKKRIKELEEYFTSTQELQSEYYK